VGGEIMYLYLSLNERAVSVVGIFYI